MTCINRFSKIVQLLPLQESDICTIAEKFVNMVVSQHGLLECITSDHDPHFCGHLWDDLMSLLDMTLIFSTTLHPQTDGIAEVMNLIWNSYDKCIHNRKTG